MLDKIKANRSRVAFVLTFLIFLILAWLLRKQLYCVMLDPISQNIFTLLVFLIPFVAGFIGAELLPDSKAILRAIGCAVAAALVLVILLIVLWPPLQREECDTPCFITVEIDLEGADATVEATLQVEGDVYHGAQSGSGKLTFRVPCERAGDRADLSVMAAGYDHLQRSIVVGENPLSQPLALAPQATLVAAVSSTPTRILIMTVTAMVRPTDTAISTPTNTPEPTTTGTATPIPTHTPEPTATGTATPTQTHIPMPTNTTKPTPTPLVIADFETCDNVNNLGGEMGAAYEGEDRLYESYVTRLSDGGCMARLEYDIKVWSAFWLKLLMLDLGPYREISFDIRADEPILGTVKVELHRVCNTVDDRTTCEQSEITYISGITCTWHTMSIPLSDFRPTAGFDPIETWAGMQELVFTFERNRTGQQGVVYLDNIKLQK